MKKKNLKGLWLAGLLMLATSVQAQKLCATFCRA